MRKGWVRWVMVGVVVVMGAGAGVWGDEAGTRPGEEHGREGHATTLPFTVAKETTGIVSPLHGDGTPDYVGALNERYGKGVTPENNAFVGWLKAVGAGADVVSTKDREAVLRLCGVGKMEGEAWGMFRAFARSGGGLAEDSEELLKHASESLWTAEEHRQLATYLEASGKPLAMVAEAARRPKWWCPYVGDSMLSVDVLPRTRAIEVAGLLGARATLRAKSGDFAGFLEDVVTVKTLARHVGSGATVLERVAGVRMDEIGTKAAGVAAGAGIFSEEQCKKLGAALREFSPMPGMAECVDECERWNLLEMIQRFAKGKDTIGAPAEYGLWSAEWVSVDWDAVLKLTNGLCDEEVRALRVTRFDEAREELATLDKKFVAWHKEHMGKNNGALWQETGESKQAYSERVGRAILTVVFPDRWKAEEWRRRAVMEDEMVGALVAAAGYRADKGKWPGKLGELVPGYLKEVPRDIYSEGGKGEVGFVSSENGAEVTSVGPVGANGERKVMEVGVKGDGEGKR